MQHRGRVVPQQKHQQQQQEEEEQQRRQQRRQEAISNQVHFPMIFPAHYSRSSYSPPPSPPLGTTNGGNSSASPAVGMAVSGAASTAADTAARSPDSRYGFLWDKQTTTFSNLQGEHLQSAKRRKEKKEQRMAEKEKSWKNEGRISTKD